MVLPSGSGPTTRVYDTGDARIDALLVGGKWGGAVGTGAKVTYSFPDADSVWGGRGREAADPEFEGFTAPQQEVFERALAAYAEVADLEFVRVAETADNVGDIRVAFTGYWDPAPGAAYGPSAHPSAGDIWFSPGLNFDSRQDSVHDLFMHELGHAIGLHHPFHDPKLDLSREEKSSMYSVMAYDNLPNTNTNAQTPLLYDILAIQHIYGANNETRAGDTIYSFDPETNYAMAVWDGGGVDKLDASEQQLAVTLDLRAGAFSSIGMAGAYPDYKARDNVAIAFGVTIEDARGGAGDDRLAGNAVDNSLEGGRGDDMLRGDAGDDRLDGGTGTDTAVYADAIDRYAFRLTGDGWLDIAHMAENGDGTDRVRSIEMFEFAEREYTLGQVEARVGDAPPPPNAAPTAKADRYSVDGFSPITLTPLANDVDQDGDPLTLVAVDAPRLGSVVQNDDGTLLYTPDAAGDDRFAYGISDGQGGTGRATITVAVTAPPSDPTDPTDPPDEPELEVVVGTAGRDVLRGDDGVEHFDGRGGGDLIYGRGGNDVLEGGAGDDRLYGDDGDDEIMGDSGNDYLLGRDGDDVLDGGDDDDYLRGGEGNDWLIGGAGNDRIRGDGGADWFDLTAAAGADRIYDFTPGEDRLVLEAAIFAQLDDDASGGDGRLDDADSMVDAGGLIFTLKIGGAEIDLYRVDALGAADFDLVA